MDDINMICHSDWLITHTSGASVPVYIIELPHDKTNKMTCAPAKTQISLASAQSDQSLHCVVKGQMFLYTDSEDSD